MKLAIFVVFKASAIENTNVKARVKEKRNRFLNQNSNLRASVKASVKEKRSRYLNQNSNLRAS